VGKGVSCAISWYDLMQMGITTRMHSGDLVTRRARGRASANKGLDAERLVAAWLTSQGYRWVASRVRGGGGEVDLVMEDHGTLVAVEVKSRSCLASLWDVLSAAQCQRVLAALSAFQAKTPALACMPCRLDIAYVHGGRVYAHIPHAWIGES
jgi:putative endonuclease